MAIQWPTDDEARAALETTARRVGDRWTWYSEERYAVEPFDHSEEEAINVAKACLYLGVPVTDTVTVKAWLTVIERIALLEQIAGLEHVSPGPASLPVTEKG